MSHEEIKKEFARLTLEIDMSDDGAFPGSSAWRAYRAALAARDAFRGRDDVRAYLADKAAAERAATNPESHWL
jgi:hypothetical protein